MSGPLVRRLATFLWRPELIDSASSSRFDLLPRRFSYALWRTKSVRTAATASLQEDSSDAIRLTESCVRRMKELQSKGESMKGKMLRLSIESGGCAGFQYVFLLDDKRNQDDRVFEKDGVKLVVDNISYNFVKGATIDYVEELIRSAFQVTTNPSAVGGCSCKSSFMAK